MFDHTDFSEFGSGHDLTGCEYLPYGAGERFDGEVRVERGGKDRTGLLFAGGWKGDLTRRGSGFGGRGLQDAGRVGMSAYRRSGVSRTCAAISHND